MEILQDMTTAHFQISQNTQSEYPYINRLIKVQDHMIEKMNESEDIFLHQDYQMMVNKLSECIEFLCAQSLKN